MCRENIRHLRLPHDSIEDLGYPAASPNEANNPPFSINELENTREFSNMYGGEFGYKDYSSEDDSLDNNDFAYDDDCLILIRQ
ncbi:hypothetical protein PanWU01x14_071090 [Parasponia andersonii]|uniref:Uncharacterized protein n=1 Tax=Parasponia andersonii TaxID=3476 RepID=A0A2P5DED2_PARAD|nr:hypothetical protein PanWU01x14_071090 [Parasponia andersonii]